MQALVDAVRLRLWVFHAGDQDLRRRKRRREFGDERDRTTDPGVDGLVAPRLAKRGAGGVVNRPAGVNGVGLADVAGGDGHLRAPRRMLFEMAGQRGQMRTRVAPGAPPPPTLPRAPR